MVHRRRHHHLRALTVSALALIGCASAPEPRGVATYADVVRARVEAAKSESSFALRHNPAACNCPPFEVRLGSTWQRVELVTQAPDGEEDPVILALRQVVERHTLSGRRERGELRVQGRLEDTLGTCGRGALYVSLVPLALEEEPAGDVAP